MICYIPVSNHGYPKIKIENDRYLLLVDVNFFFPANKKDLNFLLKEMYANDVPDYKGRYQLNTVITSIINEIDQDREYNTTAENKKLDRNIEQMKVFNGLYGGK